MTGRFLLAFCLLLQALAESSPADVCPGEHLRCPESMTCCQTSSEGVACCPFPDGTCCSDGLHCCPHDMHCNVTLGSCTKDGLPPSHYDWMVSLHSEMLDLVTTAGASAKESNDLEDSQVKKNECPDETVCHPTHTCCKMMSGKHGCCPFDGGVCCTDGRHCCPTGFKCTSEGECYSKETNFTVRGYPMKDKKVKGFAEMEMEKEDAIADAIKNILENDIADDVPIPPEYVTLPPEDVLSTNLPLETNATKLGDICPDIRYVCPAHYTCCPLLHGGYSCCPYPYATCCIGGQHCCPHGFHCMPGYCVRESTFMPPFFRMESAKREPLQDEVLLKLEDQDESGMIDDSGSSFPRQVSVP